jgi:hypothetical protein
VIYRIRTVGYRNEDDWDGLGALSWQLAEREARIREREEELGLAAVGGKGAKNRMKPLEWLGASTKRGAAATQEVLVFEDEFDDLDMDIWQHDITMVSQPPQQAAYQHRQSVIDD